MNNVTLVGRLTKNVEIRKSYTGMPVANFSLALDRGIGQDGKKRGADFPRIYVFGKQAESCSKYLAKGSMVSVTGRLQTGKYTHKTANIEIFTTDVIATKVEFLSYAKDKPADAIPEGYIEADDVLPFDVDPEEFDAEVTND